MTYLFKNKNIKAFTLVEVLVSVALLSAIMLGINSIYINIMESQRDVSQENFLKSDLEHFLKVFSNNVKLAEKGDGLSSCIAVDKFFSLPTSDDISFLKDTECLRFYLANNDGVGGIKFGPDDQFITSSQTNILDLIFEVEDNLSTGQPIVTVLVKGAPKSDEDRHMYVQTSISINY